MPKKNKVTCPNDYRSDALTPVIRKHLERLVMGHIKASMPGTLDPLQFAYRSNRSTEDCISIAIHTTLTHLDKTNTYSGENKYLITCKIGSVSYLQSMQRSVIFVS